MSILHATGIGCVILFCFNFIYKKNTNRCCSVCVYISNNTALQICGDLTMHATPSHWGPSAWHFLHAISFAYPVRPCHAEQESAQHLFQSLSCILPCHDCKQHWRQLLQTEPVDTRDRYSLSAWLVRMHNAVNKRLNKREVPYTPVALQYRAMQCAVHHDRCNMFKMCSTIGLLSFIALYFYATKE